MHLGMLRVVIFRLHSQPQSPEYTNLVEYELPDEEILGFLTETFHRPVSELSTVSSAQLSLDSTSRQCHRRLSRYITRHRSGFHTEGHQGLSGFVTEYNLDITPKVTKSQQDISPNTSWISPRRSPKANKIYHRIQSGSHTGGHQSPAGYITEDNLDLTPKVTKAQQVMSPNTIWISHRRSPKGQQDISQKSFGISHRRSPNDIYR